MRATLARKTEQEFSADMRHLESSLVNVLRNLPPQGVSPEQRMWVRETLEAAARFAVSGSRADRRALDQALRSPPRGTSRQLASSVSSAVNEAVSIPETPQQRDAVRHELERAANEAFSGSRPGEGPPAGMIERYERIMRSRPRRAH
ncbi:MAG: hypothetical protein V1861_03395 [Candidatus Micrarchaeota archaeon]